MAKKETVPYNELYTVHIQWNIWQGIEREREKCDRIVSVYFGPLSSVVFAEPRSLVLAMPK